MLPVLSFGQVITLQSDWLTYKEGESFTIAKIHITSHQQYIEMLHQEKRVRFSVTDVMGMDVSIQESLTVVDNFLEPDFSLLKKIYEDKTLWGDYCKKLKRHTPYNIAQGFSQQDRRAHIVTLDNIHVGRYRRQKWQLLCRPELAQKPDMSHLFVLESGAEFTCRSCIRKAVDMARANQHKGW